MTYYCLIDTFPLNYIEMKRTSKSVVQTMIRKSCDMCVGVVICIVSSVTSFTIFTMFYGFYVMVHVQCTVGSIIRPVGDHNEFSSRCVTFK